MLTSGYFPPPLPLFPWDDKSTLKYFCISGILAPCENVAWQKKWNKMKPRLAHLLWQQRCWFFIHPVPSGRVKGIQTPLCVPRAAGPRLPGAPRWTSRARRGGAAADERLIALPASAASTKHPGNCSPCARSSWSHEPGFSVQFISQPFWSTPCLLRTANPASTRCPGFAGKKGTCGLISANLDTLLSALPLFSFGWSSEEAFLFLPPACFLLFVIFFHVWCGRQVFAGCLGSIAFSISEDNDSGGKEGGRDEREGAAFLPCFIYEKAKAVCAILSTSVLY